MKAAVYTILLSACLSSVVGVTLHTPPAGHCPKDNSHYDSYAHVNCHKFYICDWGFGIERDCAMASATERLVFNPKLQVCDWKDAAVKDGALCSGTVVVPSTAAPTPSTAAPTSAPTNAPTVSYPPGVCPPRNEYYHSYAHETDCTSFYICDWGQPILRVCADADKQGNRLVFNPKLQVCDWRDAAIKDGAVCAATTAKPTTTTTATTTTRTTTTPTTTTTRTTTTPTTTTTSPVSYPPGVCPPRNEYYHSYPHETDCTSFYICDWGQPILRVCADADKQGNRLVFNPKLQICDWRDAAIKDGAVCAATTLKPTTTTTATTTTRTTTTPTTTTTRTTTTPTTTTAAPVSYPPGVCPPRNEYYHSYAHETDCTSFYICDWGQPILRVCADADKQGNRLVFNPKLQVCDWRDAAIKDGAVCAATTAKPTTTTTATTTTRTTTTPTTTTTRTTTTPTTTTTSPVSYPPGVCPPRNEYYHSYPHETDCTSFYICDWGQPILRVCADADKQGNRLVFNPKLQVCDWRDAAIKDGAVCAATTAKPTTTTTASTTTRTTTTPTTTRTTTTTSPVSYPPGVCPLRNEYYHSYPHGTNCNKFYKCDWGKSVEFDCPWADVAKTQRLVFNPVLQVCDWKADAVKSGAKC